MMDIFNLKSDWIYWFLGLLLAVVVFIGVFYSLSFLVENFNLALNPNLIKPEPAVRFNLEKIKELGI